MKSYVIVLRAAVLSALWAAGSASAVEPFLVLRVSTPLVASGSAGLRFGADKNAMSPSMQAEAGLGGGRIAVGLDSTGRGRFGYGFKAAVLRTWLEPIEADEDQTFLGVEGEFSIRRFLMNLGGYRRVGDGEDDWLLSAGLGFVF
jgi:hypothetical protein